MKRFIGMRIVLAERKEVAPTMGVLPKGEGSHQGFNAVVQDDGSK